MSPADLAPFLPALAKLVERMIGAGCDAQQEIDRITDGYRPRALIDAEAQAEIKKRFGDL